MGFLESVASDSTAEAVMWMLLAVSKCSRQHLTAVVRFWRRCRTHPAMWMGVSRPPFTSVT